MAHQSFGTSTLNQYLKLNFRKIDPDTNNYSFIQPIMAPFAFQCLYQIGELHLILLGIRSQGGKMNTQQSKDKEIGT